MTIEELVDRLYDVAPDQLADRQLRLRLACAIDHLQEYGCWPSEWDLDDAEKLHCRECRHHPMDGALLSPCESHGG